mmetsp:Transcript_17619/g.57689  ORF Transcript_17619/g.57689 Transcript_17619/m.57689 type:complete len:220 (+) Transcript_17619:618-1277(+)
MGYRPRWRRWRRPAPRPSTYIRACHRSTRTSTMFRGAAPQPRSGRMRRPRGRRGCGGSVPTIPCGSSRPRRPSCGRCAAWGARCCCRAAAAAMPGCASTSGVRWRHAGSARSPGARWTWTRPLTGGSTPLCASTGCRALQTGMWRACPPLSTPPLTCTSASTPSTTMESASRPKSCAASDGCSTPPTPPPPDGPQGRRLAVAGWTCTAATTSWGICTAR